MSQENASSHIALSYLVTVCWVNETALNFIPFITIYNLEYKKCQLALNQGSRVDGITMGIPHFTKNLAPMPKECTGALSCRRYQDSLS
jgi:hypothetical protein